MDQQADEVSLVTRHRMESHRALFRALSELNELKIRFEIAKNLAHEAAACFRSEPAKAKAQLAAVSAVLDQP